MRLSHLRCLTAAMAVAASAPGGGARVLGAQEGGSGLRGATDPFYRHRDITPADSIDVWRAVRSRQFRFERLRRAKLPIAQGDARHECDEIIGRFCYWDDADESWEPIPEVPEITEARKALLAALDSAVQLIPGDAWIAGQRVRYLIESGYRDNALAVAEACELANVWWCHALAGYTLHSFGEYVAAEAHFREALGAMPDSVRCLWNDVSPLLDSELRSRYRSHGCEQRDSLEGRIWWLADPLYMVPGNDRLTEHYARRALDRILERSELPWGVYWSTDVREVLIRYGWPTGWERVAFRRGRPALDQGIISHHPPQSAHFLPPANVLDDPVGSKQSDWPIDPLLPRSRYAPRYASKFDSPLHQIASFRRGDSAIVVAAYEWNPSEEDAAGPIDAALVLAANEQAKPVISTQLDGGAGSARGVLRARIRAVPMLLSLETLARNLNRAGRTRYGIQPPHLPARGLGVSDVLLIEADPNPLPQSLDQAIPLARSSTQIRRGDDLEIFWETYGTEIDTDSLSVSITIMKEGRSFLRTIAESIGLSGKRGPDVVMTWQQLKDQSTFILPHALSIELPEVSTGTYTLRLDIATPLGDQVSVVKEIEVVEPPDPATPSRQ